jgi:hypothetical protein
MGVKREKKISVYTTLRKEDYKFIKRYAERRGYTVSEVLRYIVQVTIENWKKL